MKLPSGNAKQLHILLNNFISSGKVNCLKRYGVIWTTSVTIGIKYWAWVFLPPFRWSVEEVVHIFVYPKNLTPCKIDCGADEMLTSTFLSFICHIFHKICFLWWSFFKSSQTNIHLYRSCILCQFGKLTINLVKITAPFVEPERSCLCLAFNFLTPIHRTCFVRNDLSDSLSTFL